MLFSTGTAKATDPWWTTRRVGRKVLGDRAEPRKKMLALFAMHGMLAWHAPHGKRVAPCTPARRRSPAVYCMASKDSDGRSNCKKRRKKQNENGPGESADAASGRVTSDSLMSVRKQIMYAKAYQAYKSKNVSPVYRTSFRRIKKTAQEEGDEEEKAAVEEDTTGFSVPLLFVDGYNIIGKWPRLKKRKERGDLAGARQP